jgi:hypothetical protein
VTSLPKRGDRVRVTEFRADRGRKFPLTNPVELTEDARDVGEGFISFPALAPKGAPTECHAVKVEILERANSCPTCRDTPVFDARCPCPTCGPTGTPEILERAKPAAITILTHARGCTYPSGGKQCTCRWSKEQLRDPAVRALVKERADG